MVLLLEYNIFVLFPPLPVARVCIKINHSFFIFFFKIVIFIVRASVGCSNMCQESHPSFLRGIKVPEPHMPVPCGYKVAVVLRERYSKHTAGHLVGCNNSPLLRAKKRFQSIISCKPDSQVDWQGPYEVFTAPCELSTGCLLKFRTCYSAIKNTTWVVH